MTDEIITLTALEAKVLDQIRESVREYGNPTWADCVQDCGTVRGRQLAGAISSLNAKGVVTSSGSGPDAVIELHEAAKYFKSEPTSETGGRSRSASATPKIEVGGVTILLTESEESALWEWLRERDYQAGIREEIDEAIDLVEHNLTAKTRAAWADFPDVDLLVEREALEFRAAVINVVLDYRSRVRRIEPEAIDRMIASSPRPKEHGVHWDPSWPD